MFIRDIMSKCVAECTEDLSLEAVFELLKQCDHGLVVVVDSLAHRVPIGVVTERSICEQIIERGRNPRNLVAGSVIDSRIKKVCDTDLVESINPADAELAAVVVIDGDRSVCGLLTREKVKSVSSVVSDRGSISSSGIRQLPAFGWIQ